MLRSPRRLLSRVVAPFLVASVALAGCAGPGEPAPEITGTPSTYSGVEELRDAFVATIDSWLPGLVGEGGRLSPEDLRLSAGSGVAGLVAAGVFVWSASAFMGALGAGLRAMVDESTPKWKSVPPTMICSLLLAMTVAGRKAIGMKRRVSDETSGTAR